MRGLSQKALVPVGPVSRVSVSANVMGQGANARPISAFGSVETKRSFAHNVRTISEVETKEAGLLAGSGSSFACVMAIRLVQGVSASAIAACG